MSSRSLCTFVLGSLLVFLGAGCKTTPTPPVTSTSTAPSSASSTSPLPVSSMPTPTIKSDVRPVAELQKRIRLTTTKGDIVIQLSPEFAPIAATNFLTLVEQSFYDGILFHRVIPGFMIQGGDPTGTGMSGPGYTIKDEPVKGLEAKTYKVDGKTVSVPVYQKGLVAMARTGAPNSAGSQFFIMVEDYPLDPLYIVFGKVIEGQDVADAISNAPRGQSDRPHEDVRIISAKIES